MTKRLFFLSILLLIPLVLVACAPPQPATPTAAEEAPAATEEEPAAQQPAPTVNTGPQMECTLVSNQQESTPELEAILGVKENDWVYGPETAAVTIVEYSDFQ